MSRPTNAEIKAMYTNAEAKAREAAAFIEPLAKAPNVQRIVAGLIADADELKALADAIVI